MKIISGLRALMVLSVLALALTGCDYSAAYTDELKEIAVKVNQKCPQMLDSETRLDGIDIVEPNTLVYKHTLVHVSAVGADTQAFNRALWPGLVSNIKVSRDMKKLRENQTTVVYSYADKNAKPITSLTITPQHYK